MGFAQGMIGHAGQQMVQRVVAKPYGRPDGRKDARRRHVDAVEELRSDA